jgi:putative FmdB family regulatory protein
MPFYEYECQSCKFYTEVMQKITDTPLTKCPSCGKKALKKLVSAPVFRLKGGGWYETDFKSDKENKRNLSGTEKEEPKSEAKPDSKPETKPDAKEATTDAKAGKEAKEAKPAEAKPAEAKPAEAKGASGGARRGGRPAAPRVKAKKSKGSRKGRR